ncbi:MAG: AAA family ATPase [Niastella sp.]|nr:AAA family ATPase [Niastella sp.]
MQIKQLKIVSLYGYLTKDIYFNEDLTLLVGINGSGKTSILNILNWMLKPSLPNLCVIEFKVIELFFVFNNIDYKIICKHNKTSFTYNVKCSKDKFAPLVIRLKTPPLEIVSEDQKKSLLQVYSSLSPEAKEKKTWDFIEALPSPNVIGLDRNLFTEEADRLYVDGSFTSRRIVPSEISSRSPLSRVEEIVNQEYRKRKNAVLNLTSKLKNQLMLSAFDGSITIDALTADVRHKLKLNQIEGAEKRVKEYFTNIEKGVFNDSEQETVSKYFAQLKDVIQQYQLRPNDEHVKLLYSLNTRQFIKVNRLLKEFEKFENDSNEVLQGINTYIDTLNYFLKDSAKRLVFKEDTAEIKFNNLDKNGDVISGFNNIKFLSSGEQQILILFSYVAFNSQDGKIFIIDEPELSLHIKWQEDFLAQLERVTPKATQLILATHSPILVSKRKDKAKLLLPYNG